MTSPTTSLAAWLLCCVSAAAQKPAAVDPGKGQDLPGHHAGASSLLAGGGSDDCSTAAANDSIAGTGFFPVSTAGATTGAAPQPQGGIRNDVWFRWTAPASGVARLSLCGATTVDTVAAAWDANNGTACPSGAPLAWNDDACAYQSRLTFAVQAGSAYFLQLGSYTEGVTWSGVFALDVLAPPGHDSCSAALPLVGDGPFSFDTTLATTGTQGQSEALCGGNGIARDLWYSWTATASGPRAVSTLGASVLDTRIAVYETNGCPAPGSALACNDDEGGAQSLARFVAVAGRTYMVQLGQSPASLASGGTGSFALVDPTPPPNDDCGTPQLVVGPGPHMFSLHHSTTGVEGQSEAACLAYGTTAIGRDLWFAWRAPTSGPVVVANCGSTTGLYADTRLAVYAGAACPAAAALACNDDAGIGCPSQNSSSRVVFTAVCGQWYLLQYGCYGDEALEGAFTISAAGAPCSPGDGYCFGDGSAGAACPCGNTGSTGHGCANSSVAAGARLEGSGAASLSADSLLLTGSGMTNSSALYFQGTAQVAFPFGDGLRCAGGAVVRLGTKQNSGGSSQWPGAGDPTVSQRGGVASSGLRHYQIWYRNADPAYCTSSTFNLSNGYSVLWAP